MGSGLCNYRFHFTSQPSPILFCPLASKQDKYQLYLSCFTINFKPSPSLHLCLLCSQGMFDNLPWQLLSPRKKKESWSHQFSYNLIEYDLTHAQHISIDGCTFEYISVFVIISSEKKILQNFLSCCISTGYTQIRLSSELQAFTLPSL